MKHTYIALMILGTGSMAAWGARGEADFGDRPPPPPSPDKMAVHLLADFDADQSGGLDAAELADGLAFLHEHRPPPPPEGMMEDDLPPLPPPDGDLQCPPPGPDPDQMAANLVDAFDEDADGQLNQTELTAAMAKLRKHHRPPPPPEE